MSGTHGKTTTSALAAWILHHAGLQPGFLIGGVPSGFTSGCQAVPADVHNTRAGVFVVEGDEYDTAYFDKRSKFVHYRPTVAIMNNIEYDHADIFDSLDAVKRSFSQLVRIVPRNGLVLANADDEAVLDVIQSSPCPVHTVGMSSSASWNITQIQSNEEGGSWWLVGEKKLGPFTLTMPGEHNIRNASMAILSALFAGVTMEEAQLAVAAFVPPKRRLEVLGMWNGALVIDDFAHHPTAIRHTLSAVRQRYPHAAIHAVFEPRSNTTTRSVFQRELGTCFTGAASVVIGPVHRPERFAPEDRLNTNMLVSAIQQTGAEALLVPTERASDPLWGKDVLPWFEVKVRPTDVILLLSNGNVGGLRALLTHSNE